MKIHKMNHSIIIFLSLIIFGRCQAQVPDSVVHKYRQIASFIKENNAKGLSTLIDYPLKRDNPLPDIRTPQEFISYYSTLFDSSFKNKFLCYNDTDIFEHDGSYGLIGGPFNGDIWMYDNCKIETINYSSAEEKKLKDEIISEIKAKMNPSVRNWKENILVAKSAKLLIRIDLTDNDDLRYTCWSKGHNISDEPDIILLNGEKEYKGTMGGVTYTFKNGDWSYAVDEVDICGKPTECGLFLRLIFKDVQKNYIKLSETK
jgi:AAA15 family ATPase/GTPase